MAEFADDGPQEIASGLFHFEPPGFLDKSKRKFAQCRVVQVSANKDCSQLHTTILVEDL
jgi:hypothetical protein